jgi:hypothetical protein
MNFFGAFVLASKKPVFGLEVEVDRLYGPPQCLAAHLPVEVAHGSNDASELGPQQVPRNLGWVHASVVCRAQELLEIGVHVRKDQCSQFRSLYVAMNRMMLSRMEGSSGRAPLPEDLSSRKRFSKSGSVVADSVGAFARTPLTKKAVLSVHKKAYRQLYYYY